MVGLLALPEVVVVVPTFDAYCRAFRESKNFCLWIEDSSLSSSSLPFFGGAEREVL